MMQGGPPPNSSDLEDREVSPRARSEEQAGAWGEGGGGGRPQGGGWGAQEKAQIALNSEKASKGSGGTHPSLKQNSLDLDLNRWLL